MPRKHNDPITHMHQWKSASLTVEAAFVMPLFLYFMLAFLYFIQIFILQEQIQSAITKMGLNLSKSAYFYKDFPNIDDTFGFDKTVFPEELEFGIDNITDKVISQGTIRLSAKKYLDEEQINRSCIKGGFEGIDFSDSIIKIEDNVIDIVLKYKIQIPIKLFLIDDLSMIQRVRLRTWTGYEVAAIYNTQNDEDVDKTAIVYITETGSVYHKQQDCSHIKLSVREVHGIPRDLRNNNGAKYYACEACCTSKEGEGAIYYITNEGTRYHTRRNCSKIIRNVKAIPLSEVGSRQPCSRCSK